MEAQVTVIVPVYNAENYLEHALRSICDQTYKNLEILAINDGSTDGSLKVLENAQKQDARIRIVTQENAGVSVARNRGIEEAKGDYILFVDADDWIDLTMVETLLTECEKTKSDVATCYLKEEYDTVGAYYTPPFGVRKVYEGKEAAGLALLNVWAIYCKLYKRELLQDVRFSDYKVAEDVLFNTCVIADTAFRKVVEVQVPYYHYYIHDGSVMTAKTLDRKFIDAMYVEETCYQRLTAISSGYKQINLIGCAVSRVFEKYAQLLPEDRKAHQKDFEECLTFAKAHKKALVSDVSDKHRKMSGWLKVYVPHLYVKQLAGRLNKKERNN